MPVIATSTDLLVDVGNVCLRVGHLDKPFLSILPHHAKVILERPQRPHVQRFLYTSQSLFVI